MNRFFLLVLPVMLAYAGAIKWVWDRWFQDGSYYSHGPVVLLAVLVLIWLRRTQWRAEVMETCLSGWWLLGPGLFLHLCGTSLTIDSLSAISLSLSLPGLGLLVLGTRRIRVLWPIIVLLLLALPPPMAVTRDLAFQLKELAIDSSLWLINGLGLEAERYGAQIAIPGQLRRLDVAPACSGLRSLVALTTLGYCIAFFIGSQHGARRWILLFAAMPIAVASNILRISSICLVADWESVDYASTTGHSILNVAEWVVDLGLLFLLDMLLSRNRGREGAR